MTINIDTLKLAKSLREAGADEKVAEALAAGLRDADTSQLATKQDIAEFKADMYKQLWIMAASIVAITVTLIKVLP